MNIPTEENLIYNNNISNLNNENDPHPNNNQNNIEQNHPQTNKKAPRTTISFVLLLLSSFIFYIYNTHITNEIENRKNFSLSLWPIYNKSQYYRIITHYFYFYGLCHMILNLFIVFFLCEYLEKLIGTIYSISFILLSLLFTSVIYLIIIKVIKIVFPTFSYVLNLNFNSEIGLSPLLFSMFTYLIMFKKYKKNSINLVNIIKMNVIYTPIILSLLLFCVTPNKSVIGNISGIISAFLIKNVIGKYCMPKCKLVIGVEGVLFKKMGGHFITIDGNEDILNNCKEVESNFMDFRGENRRKRRMRQLEDVNGMEI